MAISSTQSSMFSSVLVKLRSDSCGCATGAVMLGLGLALSSAWYGWYWQNGALSFGAIIVRILGWSFAASILGKFIGIGLHRTA